MFKKIVAPLFLMLVIFAACKNNKTERPATALETGRVFIRASLDGDFDNAENLLLKDTQNVQLFETYKTTYNRLSKDKKDKFKKSDYNINKYEDVNDSVTIINYSNSYLKKPMEIKLVRNNAQWDVDFKYTISGNLPID